jgi:hypothetical protein
MWWGYYFALDDKIIAREGHEQKIKKKIHEKTKK